MAQYKTFVVNAESKSIRWIMVLQVFFIDRNIKERHMLLHSARAVGTVLFPLVAHEID
jgi:hypothetical protein